MNRYFVLCAFLFLSCACSRPDPRARPEFARAGETAPALSLSGVINAPGGRVSDISELKGKVVVLDFWATWCEPCVDGIPAHNLLAGKFKGKPVVFISLTDEPPAVVEEFLKKTRVEGWVAAGASAEALRAYRVFGRPHTVLIGRDQKVAAVTVPGELTEERLDLLLAGQAEASPAPVSAAGAGTAAEFYLGEPAGKNEMSEFGPDHYTGSNLPLSSALRYFYPDAEKIEASAPASELLARRCDLRVRLSSASWRGEGGGLREFFAENLRLSLGLRLKAVKKRAQVYLLKPARGGPRGFGRSSAAVRSARLDGGTLKAEKMTVEPLCAMLEEKLGAPLIDESGLKGEYDYSFIPGPDDLAGINTRLIDQLGLRLLPASRRVPVLEVER